MTTTSPTPIPLIVNDCGNSQEAENFPEIRLNLNGDGEPEEIMFYNPRTGFAGKELLGESPGKGRHALALLILFTAKERKRMLTQTSGISLPSSIREFTSTLAEELTNPNRTKKKHWLVGLFGENPRDMFLEAARLKDDTVYFPDDVIVTVSNYLDGECSITDLEESFDRYSNDERKRAKKIEICVEVERSVERKGYIIRAGDRSGSITFGDQVRVKVAPNYSTSLAVFWISSDGSVSEFFPNPEKALKIPKPVVQRQKLGSLIEIPEELFLNIDTGPGTETCIVVAGTRRFDRKECGDFKKKFRKTMPNWLTNKTIDRPRNSMIKRPYLGNQTGKSADPSAMDDARIAKPKSLEEWEKQLLGRMPDKVTSIRFLHLPNI